MSDPEAQASTVEVINDIVICLETARKMGATLASAEEISLEIVGSLRGLPQPLGMPLQLQTHEAVLLKADEPIERQRSDRKTYFTKIGILSGFVSLDRRTLQAPQDLDEVSRGEDICLMLDLYRQSRSRHRVFHRTLIPMSAIRPGSVRELPIEA